MIYQLVSNESERIKDVGSDSIRGASVSVALNMKHVIEIGRPVGLKSFVITLY